MPAFLQLSPPLEAKKILLNNISKSNPGFEKVDIDVALGRVSAQPIHSPEMLPAFTRSAMDGYAVQAADTFGASDTQPAYLTQVGEVPMGKQPDFTIHGGETALIHTGGMLPQGANAVVMFEYSQGSNNSTIEICRSVASGENLLIAGEDVQPGQEVIPAGKVLRAADIGGLIALGILEVSVAFKPKVGIISSGDEVIPPDLKPAAGQVRDINTYTLSAFVIEAGGLPVRYGIIPDQPEALMIKCEEALAECDMVLITAGSSTSQRDLTANVIRRLGKPGMLVHGVNIRPGKPTILAVCNGKPVIGLPGNPVSALVIAGLFVKPVIARLLGIQRELITPYVEAKLSANVPSLAGREDWVPVRLSAAPEGFTADPIFFKSNLIFNLASADGLIRIPADATGQPAGEMVQVIIDK